MAIMIPEKPREFAQNSREDEMFRALEEGLPNDYYVIHSFKILNVKDGAIYESETDFVIFNRTKGIMCLEAKAGHPYYLNNTWYYGSGNKMSHDGPFRQAESSKWKLFHYVEDGPYKYLLPKCKFVEAVWFPSVSEEEMRGIHFPSDANKELLLLSSSLKDPHKRIEEIFALKVGGGVETNLTENEEKLILDQILCPAFEICPTASLKHDIKDIVFHRLQKEQSAILKFLIEQKTAAINGAAGTGKTMVAVRKAQDNAAKRENTLFLCYNENLCSYLRSQYNEQYIDFYDIDAFACRICNSSIADYRLLNSILEDQLLGGEFKYKHVVIDEGQDFSQKEIAKSGVISTLKTIIEDESIDGTFYVFYDRHQLVHYDNRRTADSNNAEHKLPDYITDADCKVTLYRNCRNTKNIAETSMRPLPRAKMLLADDSFSGSTPKITFRDLSIPVDRYIDRIIEELESEGIEDIVIISCVGMEASSLYSYCENGRYKNKYLVTTCRKFKGLEADAVILIDITSDTFDISKENNINLFYVGASRAKYYLYMLADMTDDDCVQALSQLEGEYNTRRPKRALASALNSIHIQSLEHAVV